MSPTRMKTLEGLRGVGVGNICFFFSKKTFSSSIMY